MAYTDEAAGRSFIETVSSNPEAQADLVRFFSGGRYSLSREEMIEKGAEGLARDFVEHMRYQTVNETTGVKDLMYARNEDNDVRGRESFGRLMEAYDTSDGGGTGFIGGALDYGAALATAPSTWLTVGTGGLGAGSKLAARASTVASQAAVRRAVVGQLSNSTTRQAAIATVRNQAASGALVGVTSRQAARALPLSLGREAARSFLTTGVVEAGIGAGMSYANREARAQTIDDYQYTAGDVARDALFAGALGGIMGGVAGATNANARNKMFDTLIDQGVRGRAAKRAASKAARDRLKAARKASGKGKDGVLTEEALKAQMVIDRTVTTMQALDPDLVLKGDTVKKLMLTGKESDSALSTTGLSLDTMRSVAAATLDIADRFNVWQAGKKFDPDIRISARIAEYMTSSKTDLPKALTFLDEVRRTYGLSTEELSYVYLADLSNAGKLLNVQSQLKRGLKVADVKAATDVLRGLSAKVPHVDMELATRLAREAQANKPKGARPDEGTAMWVLRQLDQASIAMMTSQLGTTVANIAGTGLNLAADVSDQTMRGLYRAIIKQDGAGAVSAFKGATDIIRGMSMGNSDKQVLEVMFADSLPNTYKRVWHDVLRSDEISDNSTSMLLRGARAVNLMNAVTDNTFKRNIFYSSFSRQLRDVAAMPSIQRADPVTGEMVEIAITPAMRNQLGRNVSEFLKKNESFDTEKLDIQIKEVLDAIIDRAVNDTERLTMQRSFVGKGDNSHFGRLSASAVETSRKIPFLFSQVIGAPFPRYVANQLDYINDYNPFSGAARGGLATMERLMYGKDAVGRFSDPFKTTEDRAVRQLTGLAFIIAGIQLNASGNSPDYKTLQGPGEGEGSAGYDLKRSAGPWVLHMYIGEQYARMMRGDPFLTDAPQELLDITTGMTDLGADGGLVADLINYSQDPTPTNADFLSRSLGNFGANFTYPAAVARDLVGQYNPLSAPSPYTRNTRNASDEQDVFIEPDSGLSLLGYVFTNEQFVNQLTRFFPDVATFRYASNKGPTEDASYDRPYYNVFNPSPLRTPNPITKQFGVEQRQSQTAIQEEMARLQLREFELGRIPTNNPVVDIQAREFLAKNIDELYNDFLQQPIGDTRLRYADLNNEQKAEALTIWIGQITSAASTFVSNTLDKRINSSNLGEVRDAAGFVRNTYITYAANGDGLEWLDKAASELSGGVVSSANDFLGQSETLTEELTNRLRLMTTAKGMRETEPNFSRTQISRAASN